MEKFQTTIKKAFTMSGVGLHTGQKVNLTFNPAVENHGYVFQRIDLPNQPTIKADCDLVVDTSRGTTLEQNSARISTVEHVLAALAGLEMMHDDDLRHIAILQARELCPATIKETMYTLERLL